jgi:hypothetical protein
LQWFLGGGGGGKWWPRFTGSVPNPRFTVNDDRPATEELLSANFLIPPDENMYSGKSIAELCWEIYCRAQFLLTFNKKYGVDLS